MDNMHISVHIWIHKCNPNKPYVFFMYYGYWNPLFLRWLPSHVSQGPCP